jgi:outer membrane murein-binding lipoprotein Lpp
MGRWVNRCEHRQSVAGWMMEGLARCEQGKAVNLLLSLLGLLILSGCASQADLQQVRVEQGEIKKEQEDLARKVRTLSAKVGDPSSSVVRGVHGLYGRSRSSSSVASNLEALKARISNIEDRLKDLDGKSSSSSSSGFIYLGQSRLGGIVGDLQDDIRDIRSDIRSLETDVLYLQ